MAAIKVADPLYEQVRIRAAEAGFLTVDEYVAQMLTDDVTEPQNLDHLFTPERLAHLDRIAAKLDGGGPVLSEQAVDAHFKARRESWHGK